MIRPTWKRFFDAAGRVFYESHALAKSGIVVLTRLLESELSSHRCKSSECLNGNACLRKPPDEKVISMKMFHEAKGDEVRSRTVAREFAGGVFAPEHHVGTEVGDQQNDLEGSYTSACVTRCASCVLPCLACERRVGQGIRKISDWAMIGLGMW